LASKSIEELQKIVRDSDRASVFQAHERDLHPKAKSLLFSYTLLQHQRGSFEFQKLGLDAQYIAKIGRLVVGRVDIFHDEVVSVVYRCFASGEEELASSPFAEVEIFRVVDDTAKIGIFVIDPDFHQSTTKETMNVVSVLFLSAGGSLW